VRERTELLQRLGRGLGEALAEVAAEQVAADAGDEQTRREAGDRDVRPGQEPDLLGPQIDPAPEVASEEASVGDETAAPEREEVARLLELVGVRDDVEDSRAEDRRDGRDDVAVRHRLLRQPVTLGERERQVPADDQREAEHHAVRVDRQVRRLELGLAEHVACDTGGGADHERDARTATVFAAEAEDREDRGDRRHGRERPPKLQGHRRERDTEEDRMHV